VGLNAHGASSIEGNSVELNAADHASGLKLLDLGLTTVAAASRVKNKGLKIEVVDGDLVDGKTA